MLNKTRGLAFTAERYMEIVSAIDEAVLSENLFDKLPLRNGFKMGAYLHIPAIGQHASSFPKRLYSINLPQIGIDSFTESSVDRLPPCATSAFKNQNFVWLSDIVKDPQTPRDDIKALEFFLTLTTDGLCIPLYGPHNANGYMFIGLSHEKSAFAPEMPFQIRALGELIHVRFCQIAEERQERKKLTDRELEVLELICLGKTNAEIGIILDISTNTVSGYVAKIFLKLGVSDRVSAAMHRQSMRIAV